MQNTFKSIAVAAAFSLAAFPAFAADTTEAPESAGSPFDIYFGVAIASNYVSKGVTQTEDRPAIQGYVEAAYEPFYVGVWASNVSFGGVDDIEYDLYGGVRPTFGNLSLDIGFAQYLYGKDHADYGDAYIKASYAFTDSFSLGAEYFHEVYADTDWGNITTSIGLPEDFSASGKVGWDFQDGGLVAWDAGVSRTFYEVATVDLRYYDSNQENARFVVSLSFDTSLSALKGK